MPRTLLLVGTRKGCFLLESDEGRRDWSLRGPFCEGWPVYHAVHDPATNAIYAAAASEWHGSAGWGGPPPRGKGGPSRGGIACDAETRREVLEGSTPSVGNR